MPFTALTIVRTAGKAAAAAAALALRREALDEEVRERVVAEARTRIGDRELDLVVVESPRGDDEATAVGPSRRARS